MFFGSQDLVLGKYSWWLILTGYILVLDRLLCPVICSWEELTCLILISYPAVLSLPSVFYMRTALNVYAKCLK